MSTYTLPYPTVVRQDDDGRFHLMSQQGKGWRSFSFCYPDMETLCEQWGCTEHSGGSDEHGEFIRVIPNESTLIEGIANKHLRNLDIDKNPQKHPAIIAEIAKELDQSEYGAECKFQAWRFAQRQKAQNQ